MKKLWLIVVLILVGLFALTTTLGPRRPFRPAQRLMREKAQLSQQLFTAVVRHDFSLVSTQAQKLAVLTQSASWPSLMATNAALAELGEQLPQRAEALSRAAGTSDSEAVQKSFLALTRNCVQCHRHLQSPKPAP